MPPSSSMSSAAAQRRGRSNKHHYSALCFALFPVSANSNAFPITHFAVIVIYNNRHDNNDHNRKTVTIMAVDLHTYLLLRSCLMPLASNYNGGKLHSLSCAGACVGAGVESHFVCKLNARPTKCSIIFIVIADYYHQTQLLKWILINFDS